MTFKLLNCKSLLKWIYFFYNQAWKVAQHLSDMLSKNLIEKHNVWKNLFLFHENLKSLTILIKKFSNNHESYIYDEKLLRCHTHD